jgi:hypothetical protein
MTTVEWVLTSYMLAFTSFLITMGKLGEAVGRKKTFPIGIVLYSAGGILAGARHYGLLYKEEPFAIGSFVLDLGKWSVTRIILALAVVFGAIFLGRDDRPGGQAREEGGKGQGHDDRGHEGIERKLLHERLRHEHVQR